MIEVSLSYNDTLSLELKNLKGKSSADYLRKLLKIPGIYYDFSMCKFIIPQSSYKTLKDLLGEVLLPNFSEYKLTGDEPQPPKIYDESIKPELVPNAEYHDYQEFGMKFMLDRLNKYGFALNCDDVGLGKTIQAIGVIIYKIKHDNIKKIVIACKKPLKIQWLLDIKRFLSVVARDFALPTTSYDDEVSTSKAASKEGRQDTYEVFQANEKAILICNYENFVYDEPYIKDLDVDLFIIDEVHNLSNYETKTNECVRNVINGRQCVLLTGTPITKSIKDVYGIIGLASSSYLGSYSDFTNRYLGDKDIPWSKEYRNLYEVKEKLNEVAIRRTPDDTDADFPVVYGKPCNVPMESIQKECFLKLAKDVKDLNQRQIELLRKSSLSPEESKELSVTSDRRTSMLFMEQFVSSDLNVVFQNEITRKYFKDIFDKYSYGAVWPQSPKTKQLISLVHEITDSGKKVLIFSYYNECVQYLYNCLRESLSNNIEIVAYHGAMSQKEKDNSIITFSNKDYCKVLIGTDAMGEGLNLQMAQYLINYDQPQNSGKKDQRIGRVRRLSSIYNHVIYYDLITNSPSENYHTRDEQLLSKITNGKAVADFVLEDSSNSEVDETRNIGPTKEIPFGQWYLTEHVRGSNVTYKLDTNTILDDKQIKETKEMFKGMGATFDLRNDNWIFHYNPTNLLGIGVTRKEDAISINKDFDPNTVADLYKTSYDGQDIWLIRLHTKDFTCMPNYIRYFDDNGGTSRKFAPNDIVFFEDPSSKFNMVAKELPPIPKIYSTRDLKCTYLSIPGNHSMFTDPIDNSFVLIRYKESKCDADDISNDEEIFDHFKFRKTIMHDLSGHKFTVRVIYKDSLDLFENPIPNICGIIGNHLRTSVTMPVAKSAKPDDKIDVYFKFYGKREAVGDLQIRAMFYKYEGYLNHIVYPDDVKKEISTQIRCGKSIKIHFYNKRKNQRINPETFLEDYNEIVIEPTLKKTEIVIRCVGNKIIVICDGCPVVDTIKQ